MPPKTSFARFTPFSRGKIVGKAEEGVSTKAIRKTVLKKDGRLASLRAIDAVVAKAKADPTWQGEDSSAGGRPPAFSPSQVCELKKLIDDEVGLAKVTIPYMRKRLPFLRTVTQECVRLTLQRLGLAWRLRRRKAAVARKYKPDRLTYSDWVLKQPDSDLARWAYVDGTSVYLARTTEEHEDKQRAALGRSCWQLRTGEDSLEDRNVGASAYAKSQGQPIKIWGFFCDGHLEYFVLPKAYTKKGGETTEHMNGRRYNEMVKTHFAKWRKKCFSRGRVFVAKDFERFLRNPANVQAEADAGCDPIAKFPKCSPDFNAIEGWWRKLKLYLEERVPTEMETRANFLQRFRRAVNYLNTNCREHGRALCRNQKTRARECKKLKGARTRW
jgi:transposase